MGHAIIDSMWGPIEFFLTLIAAAATALLLGLFAHDVREYQLIRSA